MYLLPPPGLRATSQSGATVENNLLLFRSGRTKTLYSSCNAFISYLECLCAAAWAQTAPSRQNADPVRKQSSVAIPVPQFETSVIKSGLTVSHISSPAAK